MPPEPHRTADNIRPLPAVAAAPDTRKRPRRRGSAWKTAAFTLLPLAVLAAAAAWYYQQPQADPAARWATATVTQGNIEDTVTALGNLQPRDYVDVGAQVSGQLMKIDVAVGDKVQAGDLLAEIDPTLLRAKVTADQAALANLEAQLVERRAQLQLAQKQLIRQQNMMKDNATSEDALQIAETAVRSNRAQIAALEAQAKQAQSTLAADEANLGYTKIYAPMTGTVVSLTARQGMTLNTNQTAPVILRIADLATMTVWTQVSEADVPRLKIGMDAYFTTLGDQEQRWHGKLLQIIPTPDVVNNVVLYPALFEVANPDGRLMTQMSAQVFFVVASVRNAVTVPVAALDPIVSDATGGTDMSEAPTLADGSNARRFSVRLIGPDGQESRRDVWIGVMNRVSAEVLSGLEPGDVVVLDRASGADAAAARPGSSRARNPMGRIL